MNLNFSQTGVELIEELVVNYMPIISDPNEKNYKASGLILLTLYEIYFSDIRRHNNDKNIYSRTITNFGNILLTN